MKKDYTHISAILDMSSSMTSLARETMSGFNAFLKANQDAPGEATIMLTRFSTAVNIDESLTPIMDMEPLEEFPCSGWTALYDAIGMTIRVLGAKLRRLPEEERPEKVIVCIITDGEENKSVSWNHTALTAEIKKQQDIYSWEFVFLGANIDASKVSQGIGIKAGNALQYGATGQGVSAMYSTMACASVKMRGMSNDSLKAGTAFNDSDRAAQKDV